MKKFRPIVKLTGLVHGKPCVLINSDYGTMSYDEISDYILSDCGGFIP